MNDPLDDNFGILLRHAMQTQPEPATSIDLAAAALEKVRVREAGLARVARMRWWGRMLGVAAGLLIVVVLGAGYWLMPTSTSTTDTSSSASSSSDTTSVSSSSSSTLDAGTVGLAVLAVAIIGVTAAGVLGTDKTIRLNMA